MQYWPVARPPACHHAGAGMMDCYGKLEAPSGTSIRPGDTGISGFRVQAFVKCAVVVPISGIASGAPRVEGLWNSEGRPRNGAVAPADRGAKL